MQAEELSNEHLPTAALIDLDKSLVGGLLEIRLLESPHADWLDRNDIDRVLAEKELQNLAGPEGTAARAELGKLLRADVLILLRTVKPQEAAGAARQAPDSAVPYFQLIASETSRGIRLSVDWLPQSKDAEADARKLGQLVAKAIAKSRLEIREIIAVPPFVSQDLTYDHDHLKTAYARVTEQMLLPQPGLVVVELEEAEMLGRELTVAGSEIRRRPPLYLLGEYRNENQGEQRKLQVLLRVRRGSQQLAEIKKSELEPEQAVDFLRTGAADLLAKTLGQRQKLASPVVEAEQLFERAKLHGRLGAFKESAMLCEASLLLVPNQPQVHREAMIMYGKMAAPLTTNGRDVRSVRTGLNCYVRGLDHLQAFIPHVPSVSDLRTPDASVVSHFLSAVHFSQPAEPAQQ